MGIGSPRAARTSARGRGRSRSPAAAESEEHTSTRRVSYCRPPPPPSGVEGCASDISKRLCGAGVYPPNAGPTGMVGGRRRLGRVATEAREGAPAHSLSPRRLGRRRAVAAGQAGGSVGVLAPGGCVASRLKVVDLVEAADVRAQLIQMPRAEEGLAAGAAAARARRVTLALPDRANEAWPEAGASEVGVHKVSGERPQGGAARGGWLEPWQTSS